MESQRSPGYCNDFMIPRREGYFWMEMILGVWIWDGSEARWRSSVRSVYGAYTRSLFEIACKVCFESVNMVVYLGHNDISGHNLACSSATKLRELAVHSFFKNNRWAFGQTPKSIVLRPILFHSDMVGNILQCRVPQHVTIACASTHYNIRCFYTLQQQVLHEVQCQVFHHITNLGALILARENTHHLMTTNACHRSLCSSMALLQTTFDTESRPQQMKRYSRLPLKRTHMSSSRSYQTVIRQRSARWLWVQVKGSVLGMLTSFFSSSALINFSCQSAHCYKSGAKNGCLRLFGTKHGTTE